MRFILLPGGRGDATVPGVGIPSTTVLYSLPSVVVRDVESSRSVAWSMNIGAALRHVDPALEEAAACLGRAVADVRRILLPLTM